ncbi:long-chain-fatty-acid--CoA ligase [bacterium BMS3Abin06]|nr:long-chain-fatty-acid--CoA ligase [bacterium BMS3Abin06]HDZ01890.1 AMP-dependent synthetase [Nitrospirota bacterium]
MLYKYLADTANAQPDKVAVIQGKRRVTYKELNLGMSQIACFLLKEGVKAGDRVGIISDNSPEYISSYLGVHKAGGISVAINPQYSAYEFNKIFCNCLPRVLIVEKKYLKSVLEAIPEVTSLKTIIIMDDRKVKDLLAFITKRITIPSHINFFTLQDVIQDYGGNSVCPFIDQKDIASIIYTSGTTGDPKGVMLSHENFVTNANSIIEYLHITQEDRIMVILPFYYSYGTSLLTTHIIAGGSLVLENSFMYPNIVLDKMFKEGVTGFAGVPSTFAILLNRSNIRNYSFSGLRYVTQAGGAMSPRHAKEISAILPGTDIYIMYGQTEATARLTYLDPEDFHRKPGSIGKAIPGVKIELIKNDGTMAENGDEGEIVAQGGNIMVGYWKNPEETERILKGGKLYTGDLAVSDDEGYLKIISRRSDMIKSGAHRISPKEIEEVILEMPEVHEVAVVGTEDEILGVAIKAVVVLKDGQEMEGKKMQKYCHQKLAPFKIPKEVVIVNELPKTSSGKVRKHLLES